jgi:hypothetical protein
MIMTSNNAKRNKDSKYTKTGTKDNNTAAPSTVTNLGDASRDITDTADVSRASIAKGRGTEEKRTAADIITGKMQGDESIQGVTQDNSDLEEKQEQLANTQDNISKKRVVNSGTSLKEDKSIDKADIYSTGESGTRHIERAQEKPPKKVEDKEKGSWKIEEEVYKKDD